MIRYQKVFFDIFCASGRRIGKIVSTPRYNCIKTSTADIPDPSAVTAETKTVQKDVLLLKPVSYNTGTRISQLQESCAESFFETDLSHFHFFQATVLRIP